jgi:hypothetical protein
LEEGDFKGAIRLACSKDVNAEYSEATLDALMFKHPPPHPSYTIEQQSYNEPLAFPVSTEVLRRQIHSFLCGSAGGFDRLLPQHLKGLCGPSSGESGQLLLGALVGLVTLILVGRTPDILRPLFFGANLIALKKCGGIRPIAVGCTLRRMASKCASEHALKSIPQMLSPVQLGFGVPRGAEAAVHATRICLNNLPQSQALLKVDFSNAFNSIRRDKMLSAVIEFIPDLLPYVHSAYSIPSVLSFYNTELASAEGVQQGNFIGPLLFCLAIHSLVTKLRSEFTIFYLDASTIGGDLCNISRDLKTLEEEGRDLGL